MDIQRITIAVRLALIALLALILAGVISALAAANTVDESGAEDSSRAITANDLKPTECASLNLTSVVQIGVGAPTNGNDLILGTPGGDLINAQNGDDCIVGGNGNDIILGGNGSDVILGDAGADWLLGGNNSDTLYGGAGDDTLNGGNQTDTCLGQAGTDTFSNCETQTQ